MTDLLPMELPELTSSQADSLAKTSALLESKPELVRAHDQDCGPKSLDLLAIYDPNTSSWRTSQICLEALANNQAGGLALFSETWPNAGMMRNGKTYPLEPWALRIVESASGFWHTPRANDAEKRGRLGADPRNGLPAQVQHQSMWPTPDTRGFCNEGAMKAIAKKVRSKAEFDGMAYRGGQQGAVLTNTASVGQSGQGQFIKSLRQEAQSIGKTNIIKPVGKRSFWPVEPSVGRVANGVPDRSHRLKCLGNAVVPQIPEMIGYAILEAERERLAA